MAGKSNKNLEAYYKAAKESNYVEAAQALNLLYLDIRAGKNIAFLPKLIEQMNTTRVKKELRHYHMSLSSLFLLEPFKEALNTNLWNLIPESYKKISPIKLVDWKADPKDEGLSSIVKDFVSIDDLRPAMAGVNFDGHGIVVTDAQKLLFINSIKKGKKGIYCMTKKCFDKIPNKDGYVDESFPNYISIIPQESASIRSLTIDTLRLYSKALIKSNLFLDNTHNTLLLKIEKQYFGVNAKNLLTCIETMAKLGYEVIDFGFNDAHKSILISPVGATSKAINFETPFIILMPVQLAESFEPQKGIMYFDMNKEMAVTIGIKESIALKTDNSAKQISGATVKKDNTEKTRFFLHFKSFNPVFILSKGLLLSKTAFLLEGLPEENLEKFTKRAKAIIKKQKLNPASYIISQVEITDKEAKLLNQYKLEDYYNSSEGDNDSGLDESIVAKSEKETGESEMEQETQKVEHGTDTYDLLVGDKWFKENPTTILGAEYQTTDRFGKHIIKVKGSIEDVTEGIGLAPENLQEQQTQALETKINKTSAQLVVDKATRDNIEKAINKTKKLHAAKALKKQYDEDDSDIMDDYLSFDEIITEYNEGLSEEEIKAWIWYKRISGGFNDESVILNPKSGWSKYIIPLIGIDQHLKQWLKDGIVCFYNGTYMPSVLYYAENIYDRQAKLLSEKDEFIKQFNQEQYDRQWNGLENIKPPKLTLTDPDIQQRLFIKPTADFAKEFRITGLTDGTDFRKYNMEKGKYENDTKTLVEAFRKWLDSIPANDFEKSNAYNIKYYYLDNRTPSRSYDKEEKLRIKQNAKMEGDQMFVRFLAEGVIREDQLKIEHTWNSKYNSYVEINYFKIPVGFSCSSTFKNKSLFIRPAQREGIGFISVHGSGCIAYDVGVGKTMTAILSIAQAMEFGQCKRPFIVVPNQTYKNWLAEIRGVVTDGKVVSTGVLPQYQVIDLLNLGPEYIDNITNKEGMIAIPEYSISVMTYEGFARLGFNDDTWSEIGSQLYGILNQGTEGDRENEKLFQKIRELMGRGLSGSMVNIEDLGFDYMVVDEAHAMKKAFTQVKGETKGDGEGKGRYKAPYEIRSGMPSTRGLKGFIISQYILRNNKMRNVVLLTATPFTNSPLEIYSILALIGYQALEQSGIKNIKMFFDNFIKTSMELVINAKLKPERKEIVMGFNNLKSLQQLIFKFISYKTGEDANIQRPNKIVLPLMNKKVGSQIIPLPPEEQISTNLPMTIEQKDFMRDIEMYVTGKTSLMNICVNPIGFEEEGADSMQGEALNESKMSEDEQEGATVLRGLSFSRQLALSPYLYSCNPNNNPTWEEYIETSPKLSYVMKCIESVKDFHEKRQEEVSGQVIYMNSGVHFFPLIKDYLIKRIGFEEKEVGIIKGGMSAAKKEGIKERFLAGDIKVLIGSATIREGINLQNKSTVLYNCWLDWNPTDVKQLEGRIWRFGNKWANVRIVNPLIENSIDTFIFQKLEEKTSRITSIFYRSGKSNALNLEEFNPSELKMGLVTDPYALAELILMEEREQMQDEINSLENQMKVLEEIDKARNTFKENIDQIKKTVKQYKPQKPDAKAREMETIFKIYKDYLEDENTETSYADEVTYDDVRKAHATIKRGLEQVLGPRGLDINFSYEQASGKFQVDSEQKKKLMEEKTGEAAVNEKAREIIEERKKKGYKSKTVDERVREFEQLNAELLTVLMTYDNEGAKIDEARKRKGIALEKSDSNIEKMKKLMEATRKMAELINRMKQRIAA